jgi:hypothetical protein
MARKEISEKYSKYKVFYLVKITKNTNLTYVVDRIRGIKNVIVAMPEHSDRLVDLSKKNNDYEFYLIKVKFLTDKSPMDVAKKIRNNIVQGDSYDGKVKGVVFVKPKLETLAPTT